MATRPILKAHSITEGKYQPPRAADIPVNTTFMRLKMTPPLTSTPNVMRPLRVLLMPLKAIKIGMMAPRTISGKNVAFQIALAIGQVVKLQCQVKNHKDPDNPNQSP